MSRQTEEIAVRIALGAHRTQVCGLILRRSAVLTAAGLGVGVLASVATGRLIASQLWNTSPRDPVTLAAAVALVIVVALAAPLVPARRAMRIES